MNEKDSTTKPMIALVILPIEQHVCLLSYLFPLTHLNWAAQLCTAACVQVKVKDIGREADKSMMPLLFASLRIQGYVRQSTIFAG